MMPCVTRDQTVIVNNRHRLLNGLTTSSQPKPKHSFSIDALVGSNDSVKDGSSSRQSSTPSPASGNKSLSPPHMISPPMKTSSAFAPTHSLPTNDLLRFMSNYSSGQHMSGGPHYVPPSHSHHPHHHSGPAHTAPAHPTPHPMALSMINSLQRTNPMTPDFYSGSVNINPAFSHWAPYMRHSQLMPTIHGMCRSDNY